MVARTRVDEQDLRADAGARARAANATEPTFGAEGFWRTESPEGAEAVPVATRMSAGCGGTRSLRRRALLTRWSVRKVGSEAEGS